jgi:tyrosine-protein phosphatase YwqE
MRDWLRKLVGGRSPERTLPTTVPLRWRDCHSHVIPGVDDGSRSMSESLDMLRLLASAGAKRVIATPHIYAGRFENEPGPLRARFDTLRAASAAAGIEVELELGAEHYCDETLVPRIERGDVVSFGPERYVLFETSTTEQIPVHLNAVVYTLTQRGYTPLMAHVERYHYLRTEDGSELLEDLRAMGAKFQVNRTVGKMNVPGQGPRGKLIATLLERGWVDEVGSDLHRATQEGRPYADGTAPIDARAA